MLCCIRHSSEVKKTDMENFRRVIGLRIEEDKEVYEGEVWWLWIVTQQGCDDMDSTLLHYSETEKSDRT